MPEPFSSLVDKVNDRDREFFVKHPDIDRYIRQYIPGEFWPAKPIEPFIEVTCISREHGIRTRRATWEHPID